VEGAGGGLMSFYDRHVLPSVIGCACRSRAIMRQRAKLIPEARGEVLEVGIGGGANLRFYDPAKVRAVHGVDPSEGLRRQAEAAPRPEGVKLHVRDGSAEALPYEDDRFDTVVCTFVLCSVASPERALAEARRVLKPAGRLLFCEHGLAPDRQVARFQRKLEPVWSSLAGGCRLTRAVLPQIQASGFVPGPVHQRYMRKAPKFVGWITWGAAA
jgi:ubiquinone/menaquinone biosynthesis C-methylase UbiE